MRNGCYWTAVCSKNLRSLSSGTPVGSGELIRNRRGAGYQ